jgi:hypothetical protein
MQLSSALKEWAIAVTALEAGDSIILLRKGGIREQTRQFTIAHSQVLLYPTYEHQKPELLKSPYAQQVTSVDSGWHPETVTIASVATLTALAQVTTVADVTALLPYHIWHPTFAETRLRWKSHEPLSVLFLQVAKLPQPITLPYRSDYGGCRSWLDLGCAIEISEAVPVLSESDYQAQVKQVRQCLSADSDWADLA